MCTVRELFPLHTGDAVFLTITRERGADTRSVEVQKIDFQIIRVASASNTYRAVNYPRQRL